MEDSLFVSDSLLSVLGRALVIVSATSGDSTPIEVQGEFGSSFLRARAE